MASKYSNALYVTENGTSDPRDLNRASYILSHAYAMLKAIESGLTPRGYFHWSINDNYEWPQGFKQKFGLFEVDLITKERKSRPSTKVFKEITSRNAINGDLLKLVVFSEKPPGELI
ncbi:MAG: family 1 glycosylhydrolase [Desulfurococcaceae archaeon]